MFASDGLEKSTLGGSSGSHHCVGLGHTFFLSEPLTPACEMGGRYFYLQG